MSDEELLLYISNIKINGFFVLTEISKRGKSIPRDVDIFLHSKSNSIKNGTNVKKFVFSNEDWRLIFTLLPTNEVVEERYAVKNKVMSVMKRKK